jgi:hypothetical protein
MRLFQTSRRFNVEIQPQLVLLQKTLLNIEGLGRQLDPELDLWATAKPFLERWMNEQVGWRAGRPAQERGAALRPAAARAAAPAAPGPAARRARGHRRCWRCWPSSAAPTGCCRPCSGSGPGLRGGLLLAQIAAATGPWLRTLTDLHSGPPNILNAEPCRADHLRRVYLLVTIGIGLLAARRVHNAKDYLVAGRSLPLYMNVATVFATWFGAETVLSVSATFAKDGLAGIPGDPFGATACLVIAALLFARLFYRMNLLTIGDFYKQRYGKARGGADQRGHRAVLPGLDLGADDGAGPGDPCAVRRCARTEPRHPDRRRAVVLVYTIFGGMWSVAFTDLFQTVVILIGLSLVAMLVGDMAGGAGKVIAQAAADGKFNVLPMDAPGWWAMAGAFFAFAFGSVPQQDVFQRMTSAKDEKTAVRGTVIGALIYFCFAFVPIFIAYAALVATHPSGKLFDDEDARDIQRILPDLVLGKMPLWAQVMFFGALLSAILSTASGALLAPTASSPRTCCARSCRT